MMEILMHPSLRSRNNTLPASWGSLFAPNWLVITLSSRLTTVLNLPSIISRFASYVCSFCCCLVTNPCLTLCNPRDCSSPGFPVCYLPEFAQAHVQRADDAIQPSHLLSPPSLPALNLSQDQGLFQWVGFSQQVARVLELLLQHQSFQWIFRVDFL